MWFAYFHTTVYQMTFSPHDTANPITIRINELIAQDSEESSLASDGVRLSKAFLKLPDAASRMEAINFVEKLAGFPVELHSGNPSPERRSS